MMLTVFERRVQCVSNCCPRCVQDDAAAAGLRLPGPEDHGPGGAAPVSGGADRAAAALQRVSRRAQAHIRKQKFSTERGKKNPTRAAQTGLADAASRNHHTPSQIAQAVLQVDSSTDDTGTDKRLHSCRNTPSLANLLETIKTKETL